MPDLAPPADDPADERAEALAARVAAACAGEPDDIVICELIALLGEVIGRSPRDRQGLCTIVDGQLRHYVSEIPPLPDDA